MIYILTKLINIDLNRIINNKNRFNSDRLNNNN